MTLVIMSHRSTGRLEMIDYKNLKRDGPRRLQNAVNIAALVCQAISRLVALHPSAVVGALGGRVGLYESAVVRVDPTGTVSVFTGTHSHGQGHDTTFAQIVADKLGIPIARPLKLCMAIQTVFHLAWALMGLVRWLLVAQPFPRRLDKVIEKGKIIAAHMLEAADADMEFKDGKFAVAGTDKEKSFGEIALSAYVPHNFPHDRLEPGLEETAFYDPLNFTYPSGTHIAEVEIDPATGVVDA